MLAFPSAIASHSHHILKQDELEDLGNDDTYVLFDCPGQIELYSHIPAMRHIVDSLQRMRFRVCAIYLLDSQFVADVGKFIAGVLCCLSVSYRP